MVGGAVGGTLAVAAALAGAALFIRWHTAGRKARLLRMRQALRQGAGVAMGVGGGGGVFFQGAAPGEGAGVGGGAGADSIVLSPLYPQPPQGGAGMEPAAL